MGELRENLQKGQKGSGVLLKGLAQGGGIAGGDRLANANGGGIVSGALEPGRVGIGGDPQDGTDLELEAVAGALFSEPITMSAGLFESGEVAGIDEGAVWADGRGNFGKGALLLEERMDGFDDLGRKMEDLVSTQGGNCGEGKR